MVESFRPYPEAGNEAKGSFQPSKVLAKTIIEAPIHFLAVIPHLLIPIYGIYRLLKGAGFWTAQVDFIVEGLLVPLLQGLSVGGLLGTCYLRYLTPEGRKIANKRQDGAATDEEDTDQHRLDLIFWGFLYLGFATVIWQQLPAAHGPGVTAFKKLVGQVGVDLGDRWKTRSY